MQIRIDEVFKRPDLLILDVRTWEEFEKGSILGAQSFPLFDEKERAAIGLLYKKRGRGPAMEEGFQMLAEKFPIWIDSLLDVVGEKKVAVMCWRGGMRSESAAVLLRALNHEAYRVEGGYKSYRNFLIDQFERLPNPKLITFYGLTGTGKTDILQELKKRNYPVVDLEALANHRGSAFGHIGLGDQPTQQWFESRLFSQLKRFEQEPYLFIEGESRKIGRVFLPENLLVSMRGGVKVQVCSSVENRVKRVLGEYEITDVGAFYDSVSSIEKRLGGELTKKIRDLLADDEYEMAAGELLTRYYDRCYQHARKSDTSFDFQVQSDDVGKAVEQIEKWYDHLPRN